MGGRGRGGGEYTVRTFRAMDNSVHEKKAAVGGSLLSLRHFILLVVEGMGSSRCLWKAHTPVR